MSANFNLPPGVSLKDIAEDAGDLIACHECGNLIDIDKIDERTGNCLKCSDEQQHED